VRPPRARRRSASSASAAWAPKWYHPSCPLLLPQLTLSHSQAFNLFSKTLAASPDSRFVVADALPAAAASFAASFAAQFPHAPRVEVARAPADVIRAAGTVVTMLPSSPHVRAVYQGEGGLRAGLAEAVEGEERTLCVDGTTLDVEVAREVAGDMISAGADMIDAPVSGGESLLVPCLKHALIGACNRRHGRQGGHALLPVRRA
jgi:hypothetical protein